MGLLDGQRAVVTGGGSGIGRATCRRMVEEGARVAVVDVDADATEAVGKELDAPWYHADVTDFGAVEAAFKDADAQLGGVTAVFNNAGGSSMSEVHQWPLEEWERIVTLNLTGVFHGFRAGVPLIQRSGGGSIVSTSSISGTRPSAGEAPYSAAKAAVAALTATAALEYAPAIRVNAVAPGMILTGLTGPLFEIFGGIDQDMIDKTPLARIGAPEEIADVVVFLCSDLARFVTGQNIVVDGGMTLHGAGVDGILARVQALAERGAEPPSR
jgi:NAD(P)-dependent dehydrogenase (short-subunit alcohol dehydrogenase family)